jgi:hypothetical protein
MVDIKEIAKELTRKEFLNLLNSGMQLEYKNELIDCPLNLGLKNDMKLCSKSNDILKCNECWARSVRYVQFKGESVPNKAFETIIELLNESLSLFNIRGYKLYDEDNQDYFIARYYYDKEDDCIKFATDKESEEDDI